MFGFILLVVLGLAGAGAIAASAVMRKPGGPPRWPFAAGGGVVVLLSGLLILLSSLTTIGPSDVGIVTAFGHTVGGDLGPGMHPIAPWDSVTVWDDSVQRTAFESGKGGTGCLEIRIAGQQNACLDVIVFWKDQPSASDSQFKAYRTFPRVQSAYFSRGVVTKFYNNVFEGYDPIKLATLSATGKGTGVTISALTRQVATQMRAAYASTADIVSLNSGQIHFGPQVEGALNREIAAKANFNTAVVNEQAAQAQHAAAQKLATGNVLTPAVVEQNCLNITQTITQGGGSLPPAWTCTGSGAGILVNARP